jgi:glutaminase
MRHETIGLQQSSQSLRILAVLNELHMMYRDECEGDVARYIPELAKTPPDLFAISVFTVDGEAFNIGDSQRRFTLQSLANPFVYGMVLDDLGRERVLQSVGVEPTGNPFNAIVLDRRSNRPMNPMVNAGAIAVTSLVDGPDPTTRLNNILAGLGRYTGRQPTVDMEVFVSEKCTSDRNRSIAYLMRNFGVLQHDIDETLDLYIQQCSVSVSTSELAVMAATLANGGINPQTGERAISPRSLRDVLTIMYTCGLNESSGQWVHSVGIPAKSGVSGGLMAVVPGRMGIGIFSPRVDASGTSVRGQLVCRKLATMLNLHIFQHARVAEFSEAG